MRQEIIVLIYYGWVFFALFTQDSRRGLRWQNHNDTVLGCDKESNLLGKKYNTIPLYILVKSHSCKLPKQKKAFNQMESKV